MSQRASGGQGGTDPRFAGRSGPGQPGPGPRERGSPAGRNPGQAGAGRGYPGTGGSDGGFGARRQGPLLRWIGALPPLAAVCVVAGAAVLGAIGTLVTGGEPGRLLDLFIIVGCVVAALGIRRRASYVLIPLPALTFFLAAVLTGAVRDRSLDTSKAALAASFLQWIADVFFGMCAATILVLVIAGGRWLVARQFVSGRFLASAAGSGGGRQPDAVRAPGQRASREPRTPRYIDPWGAADARDPRLPRERGQRGGQRDRRDSRDPQDPQGTRRQRAARDPRDPWAQR